MAKSSAVSALVALAFSPVTHAGAAKITDGKDLLRARRDRYQHDWHATLTFEQTSTTHNPVDPAIFDPRRFTQRHWEK